jgi:hypothetical protein
VHVIARFSSPRPSTSPVIPGLGITERRNRCCASPDTVASECGGAATLDAFPKTPIVAPNGGPYGDAAAPVTVSQPTAVAPA